MPELQSSSQRASLGLPQQTNLSSAGTKRTRDASVTSSDDSDQPGLEGDHPVHSGNKAIRLSVDQIDSVETRESGAPPSDNSLSRSDICTLTIPPPRRLYVLFGALLLIYL